MQKLKIVLLISISCHASIVCMHRWLRDQNVRCEMQHQRFAKELIEELMNSREFDSFLRDNEMLYALARRPRSDDTKEFVTSQNIFREMIEEEIRVGEELRRTEDLENRMREVRLHMAEKRRKKG
jgi:hypothetical protein